MDDWRPDRLYQRDHLAQFEFLFSLLVTLPIRCGQTLLGFLFCIYRGWLWPRDSLLQALRKGYPDVERGLFWKIWPWYVKLVRPLIITAIIGQSLFE